MNVSALHGRQNDRGRKIGVRATRVVEISGFVGDKKV